MFERHLCSFVERLVAFAILQLARGSYYVSDLIPSNMFLSVMHRQKKKKVGQWNLGRSGNVSILNSMYTYLTLYVCLFVNECLQLGQT